MLSSNHKSSQAEWQIVELRAIKCPLSAKFTGYESNYLLASTHICIYIVYRSNARMMLICCKCCSVCACHCVSVRVCARLCVSVRVWACVCYKLMI